MPMARPKGKQEPRITISIRVSAFEKRRIEQKAKEQGKKVSVYIRQMAVHGGMIDPQVHKDRQKLVYEISAIGNNINQIARAANTKGYIRQKEVQETRELLQQVQQLIRNSMERQTG